MFRHSGLRFLGHSLQRVTTQSPPQLHFRIAAASTYKRATHPFNADALLSSDNRQLINENRPLSDVEWQTLRNDLFGSDRSITEVNIDATILGHCLPDGLLETGKSYVRFLRVAGRQPNLATLGRLLRLYHNAQARGIRLSDRDCEDIVHT